MLTEAISVFVGKIPRLSRFARSPLNKARVISVGHKANILAVGLRRIYKAVFFGYFTHLRLCKVA